MYRSYSKSGLLLTDTLKIRTVRSLATGGDTTSHVYGLSYAYDLDGRRTRLKHPDKLLPHVASQPTDSVRYAYDPTTGELASVRDILGDMYSYTYDEMGHIASQSLFSGMTGNFVYDQFGRLATRSFYATTNVFLNRYIQHSDADLGDEQLYYDGRGNVIRMVNLHGVHDSLRVAYNGLGALNVSNDVVTYDSLTTTGTHRVTHRSTDTTTFDANANAHYTSTWSIDSTDGHWTNWTNRSTTNAFDTMGRATSMGSLQFKYDAAGNTVYSESNNVQRMSYFDAENRLRAADYRVVGLQQGPPLYGAWEEYRYDALGRRILVRTNAERYAMTYCDGDGINPLLSTSYAPRQCVARVRRIVWDGDQELYEIQAPAWDQPTDNYLTPKLENDTTSATNGADSRFYGRVAYTHGLELDHPLNAIRMGYSHSLWGTPRSWQDSALVITPHWTWRGVPDDGSFADGGALHCKTPSDPSHQTCVLLNWSFGLDARLYKLQQPLGWFGGLLDQRTDATGDQNMRNRNYDPLSGRFTQEDPIGLAGGLNVYGFAGGDPVNYADPFGLSPTDIIVEGKNSQMIVDYLNENSSTFRETFDRLNNDHSVQLTIRDAYDPDRSGAGDTGYLPGAGKTGTIRFNDVSLNQANYQLFKADPKSSWMFTAASSVAHEMGHANAYLGNGPAACKTDSPPRCILRYENKVRSELPAGQGGGTRTRYDTQPGRP